MIFHCTKFRLSNCNSSRVVSIKKNVSFKFQSPVMFVFLVFTKQVLVKVVHPLMMFQNTKFHDPALTGASFSSLQKFERSLF
jgi:hypothetical protein